MKKDINIRMASNTDVSNIYSLMLRVYNLMPDKSLFVCDDFEYINAQITKTGFGIVAMHDDVMAGSLVIRFPYDENDNLGIDIKLPEKEIVKVAHIEAVVVAPEYRGHKLQYKLIKHAEKLIDTARFSYIMATVSPDNHASMKNFLNAGYVIIDTKNKYCGLQRNILYKKIKSNRHHD